MNDPDELGHAEECSERPAPSDLRERAVKALREVDRALGDERATVGTVSDALKPLRAAIAAMPHGPLFDGFATSVSDSAAVGGRAALPAVDDLTHGDEAGDETPVGGEGERLREKARLALERIRADALNILNGRSVRSFDETLAEVDSAIAALAEGSTSPEGK
jgi:hypothetical protein